MIAFPLC